MQQLNGHDKEVGAQAPAALITIERQAPAAPLSPSQINQFLACQVAWYYKKRLELPEPASAARIVGSSVHAGITFALHAKLTVQGYPEADLLQYVADFTAAAGRDAGLAEIESAKAIATAERLTAAYYTQRLPDEAPAEIEKVLSGLIAGIPVRGEADQISKTGRIIDYKTAARKPAGISAAHQLQLAIYGKLAGATHGELVTITKTKVSQVHVTPLLLDRAVIKYAEKMVSICAEAMERGLYTPNRGNTFCSRTQCAFWAKCESDYGGIVPGHAAEE